MSSRLPRLWLSSLLSTIGLVTAWPIVACAAFPDQPIKVIVYTQPGGLIDVTARRFAERARQLTGKPMIVENMPGAGGLIAMEHLLALPPDGYTILACTKTNIAKAVVTEREDLLDELDWAGLLLMDPESLVARRDGAARDWSSLLADAQQRPGEQIWIGPGSGTMDHLMAIRVWDAFQIRGRWIPYGSGGRALAAVSGRQGDVYVGNPGDALEHDDLRVVAISSDQRLPQWPDTPTFGELGHPELNAEFIWRGFALPPGAAPEVRDWYDQLFARLAQDEPWKSLWEPRGIRVVHLSRPEFTTLVQENRQEFRRYLDKLNVTHVPANRLVEVISHGMSLTLIFALQLGVAVLAAQQRIGSWWRGRLIPLGIVLVCMPLWAETWRFPSAWEGVGAAAAPRLWLALTTICGALAFLFPVSTGEIQQETPTSQRGPLLLFCMITAFQWWFVTVVGYYIGTAIGMYANLSLLGGTRHRTRLVVTSVWLLVAYVIFERLLRVELPRSTVM